MSSSKTEAKAINEIKRLIEYEDFLLENLDTNDKTPSFDGFISLYNNTNHKKEHMIGRVAVQIKGRTERLITGDKKSFSIKKSDLKNFLADGGCLFFYVQIDKNDRKQVFYKSLLPIDLRKLLEKDKTSINLEKLDGNITNIVRDFLKHKNLQATDTTISLDNAEEIEIYVKRDNKDKNIVEMLKRVFSPENYIYGTNETINGKLPIDSEGRKEILVDGPTDNTEFQFEQSLDSIFITYHKKKKTI